MDRLAPEGAGKTHYLSEKVEEAARRYGPHGVMVCSFTRAAAAEISSRVNLPRENVGTLHAICLRAIGGGAKLTQGMEGDFSEAFPQYRMKVSDSRKKSVDDPYQDTDEETEADGIRQRMDVLRARRTDERLWPDSVRAFHRAWTDWKNNLGLLDFTDLLEIALRDVEAPPGDPAVMYVDEVQDSPRLQLDLILKWSKSLSGVVMAGDDDQALYAWAGAVPEDFLGLSVPEEHKRILEQSYRVPRAVHAVAERLVKKIRHRQPKEYRPRDFDGAVERCAIDYKRPEMLLKKIKPYTMDGKSVLVLTSCRYMLGPLMAVLKQEGIPFHNPYRTRDGGWNPLLPGGTDRRSGKSKVMPVDRVLSFLRPDAETHGDSARMWTKHDLSIWMEHFKADGFFSRGGKDWIKKLRGEVTEFDPQELLRHVLTEHHDALFEIGFRGPEARERELAWWLSRFLEGEKKKHEYPVRVAQKHGGRALLETPQIMIGTGHSVKGGQADVVIVFPDLSRRGMETWMSSKRDEVLRLFYVMVTRARERLVICSQATPMACDAI